MQDSFAASVQASRGTTVVLPPYLLQRREALLIAVLREAQRRHLPEPQIALELYMSVQRLRELLWGCERIENIDAKLVQHIAAFLGWPVISVLLAAGTVRLEDFFTKQALQQTHDRACTHWPVLRSGTALCAVLALALAGQEVVLRRPLRAVVADGPQ